MNYKELQQAARDAIQARNREIFEKSEGLSYARLAAEYGITRARVQQIVKRERQRCERKAPKQTKPVSPKAP